MAHRSTKAAARSSLLHAFKGETRVCGAHDIIFRRRQRLLVEARGLYDTADAGTIEAQQVQSFNRVWEQCLREVPFYRDWARTHSSAASHRGNP